MTRHSGTSPNACTQDRTKNVAGVADNPERGKAQGRNDRRAIKSMQDLIDGGDTDRSRERKPRSRIDSTQTSGSVALQICLFPPTGGTVTPTKTIGARMRSINRHVGPDEQKCSRRCGDMTIA
jgi:hypothetical protein